MKKGTPRTISLIIIGLLFLAVGILTAMDIPFDKTINNEGYSRKIQGSVEFSHLIHATDYGIACADCHHEYEDGVNIWQDGDPVKNCIECHHPQKDQGNARRLMMAYHNSCLECHKTEKNEGKEAPVQCNDCHSS